MSGHAKRSGELVASWRFASQSYDLEPDSPIVIETLAAAWESLGVHDKAERLLVRGLDIAGDNSGLRTNYFFLLLRQNRLEKAARLLQEQYGDSVEDLPQQLQQDYYFKKSLISLVAGDRDAVRGLIEQTIGDDSEQDWNRDQILFMTFSSALQGEAGNTELAEQRLARAERAIRRARLNGADDADMYYMESSIHALRGQPQAALESLQTAYEKGFREIWLLDIDMRLESIHQEPRYLAIRQQIERDIAQARSEVESFIIAAL
jgi:hypothetical protein